MDSSAGIMILMRGQGTLANLYSSFLAEATEVEATAAVSTEELLLEDKVSSSLSLRVSFSVWNKGIKKRSKMGIKIVELLVGSRKLENHAISMQKPRISSPIFLPKDSFLYLLL